MSVRRRWRTRLAFATVTVTATEGHRSKTAAYEYVRWLAAEREAGRTPVTDVDVQVDEGTGWRTYETVSLSAVGT